MLIKYFMNSVWITHNKTAPFVYIFYCKPQIKILGNKIPNLHPFRPVTNTTDVEFWYFECNRKASCIGSNLSPGSHPFDALRPCKTIYVINANLAFWSFWCSALHVHYNSLGHFYGIKIVKGLDIKGSHVQMFANWAVVALFEVL